MEFENGNIDAFVRVETVYDEQGNEHHEAERDLRKLLSGWADYDQFTHDASGHTIYHIPDLGLFYRRVDRLIEMHPEPLTVETTTVEVGDVMVDELRGEDP